jgi:hypothetical protein
MSTNDQDYRDDESMDAFERRLARISLRTSPFELRMRVLDIVNKADSVQARATSERSLGLRKLGCLKTLFGRVPIGASVWAALWLFIGVTHSFDRWLNGSSTQAAVAVSTEQMVEARRQRAELRQLVGLQEVTRDSPKDLPETDIPDPAIQPQSRRRPNETEWQCRRRLSPLKTA